MTNDAHADAREQGNLALCRFNSKLVALQIKAQLDGNFKGNSERCQL